VLIPALSETGRVKAGLPPHKGARAHFPRVPGRLGASCTPRDLCVHEAPPCNPRQPPDAQVLGVHERRQRGDVERRRRAAKRLRGSVGGEGVQRAHGALGVGHAIRLHLSIA
jgi:hypothetical protein